MAKRLASGKPRSPQVSEAPSSELLAMPVATVPTQRRARMTGVSEPFNLSTQMDADRIQTAIRAAERGETWQLFAIYRDMILGFTHLQSEWTKRKMVVVGQPHALIPKNKDNVADVAACKAIQLMIDHCDNWMDGMSHLLDATLYPVSVAEKIYAAVEPSEADEFDLPIRYKLKAIYPVNPALLCFKVPYMPQLAPPTPFMRNGEGYATINPALSYDADSWEPELRFYDTLPDSGSINYSLANVYGPDRERHIIHRGDILSKSIRDNFGGPMRAILFWWLLATKDRDWFGIFMQKYGSPFLLGKADVNQADTVAMLREAFSTAVQIGGLVIDRKAEAQLIQASATDGANSHKTLITVCNDEVSKIVVGQVLSSTPKNTGLGSGVASLHGEVRQDYRLFDMKKLSETLKRQLFRPFLRINGYRGNPPDILWGGEKEGDAEMLANSVSSFYLGGLEPTDEGIEVISQRVGYDLRRRDVVAEAKALAAANPKPKPGSGSGGGGNGN